MTHTPGPWTVFEDYGGERTILGPDGESIIEVDNNGCESDPMPDHIAISPGNAYLMAAAPDLLKALTDLIAVCEPNIYPQPDKPDSPWAKLQAARAAIAKTTNPKG